MTKKVGESQAMSNELRIYSVRNSDGKWFRRKGYGGGGDTWVDDLKIARLYAKIGPARGTVSYFANHFQNYPAPQIVVFKAVIEEVLDESKRIQQVRERDEQREAKREARHAEYELEAAQRDFEKAQQKLSRTRDEMAKRRAESADQAASSKLRRKA